MAQLQTYSSTSGNPGLVSDRVQFITHKGKKVLFVNYADCDVPGLKAVSDECHRVISQEPLDSVLTLSDVSGSGFDQESVEVLKSKVAANAPYVKRAAVIGINGLQRLIYEAIKLFTKRNLSLFSNREEALDWLVKG